MTQLYLSFRPDNPTVAARISGCLTDISAWMKERHLQLNLAKTSFLSSLPLQLYSMISPSMFFYNYPIKLHSNANLITLLLPLPYDNLPPPKKSEICEWAMPRGAITERHKITLQNVFIHRSWLVEWTSHPEWWVGVDQLSALILSILPIIDIGHFKNRFADNFFFYANKHTIYRWHYLLVNK